MARDLLIVALALVLLTCVWRFAPWVLRRWQGSGSAGAGTPATQVGRFDFLERVVEHVPAMIFIKDARDLRFVLFNKAGEEIVGVPGDEMIDKTDYDFFPEEQADFFTEKDRQVLQGREVLEIPQEPIDTPTGRRWLHTRKVPLVDRAGNPEYLLGISIDITEQKRQREEHQRILEQLQESEASLLVARDKAEAASRAKSQFLANMSHDIRTPMNGILGFTELLQVTRLDLRQQEYLRLINQSTHSLLGLLNDILDFSKIEAGQLQLETTRFLLDDLLADSLQTLAPLAAEKRIELSCRSAPELADLILAGDQRRLRQVVDNLVSNAIKFTDEGHVYADARLVSREDGEAVLRIEVQDTGHGIPRDQQQEIFLAFRQLERSAKRTGIGLGLSIASRLVTLMGGEIGVESEAGQGSTFWFTVRVRVEARIELPGATHQALRDQRVLIVDDSEINRQILSEYVERWGMKPTAFASGPEALEQLSRAAAGPERYALVLLDQVMPAMDGITVATKIRDDPRLGNTPILLLSSAGVGLAAADVLERLDLRSLPKPVKQKDLRAAISEALGAPVPQEAQVTAAARAPVPRTVLVVEDSIVNQALVMRLLEVRGHHATLVENGREAVEAFAPGRFDVILMDIQMPEMDGFEATRRIRQAERAAGTRTPIIAMTAGAMREDQEQCLEAGMDDYVSKPASSEEIYRVVEQFPQQRAI